MHSGIKTRDIDVLILCGGKGERLKCVVSDRPKPMAEVNSKPFLDILIDYISGFGFRRFILCLGYGSDYIKKYYKNKNTDLKILFSEEKTPLGTGGAIKNAELKVRSNPFLVINGDSFCKLDLNEFINFYFINNALFSIVLVKDEEGKGKGTVTLGDSQEVISFDEKANTGHSALVNAGIYLFEKRIFSMIPPNKNFSFEYELAPGIVNNRFYGFITGESLIDIGTSEGYREANK